MIKTLRKKFILVNMLLVFTVLAFVFGAVTLSNYRIAVYGSRVALQMLSSRRETPGASPFIIGQQSARETALSRVILVRVSPSGEVMLTASVNMGVTDGQLVEIAFAVLEDGSSEGVLREYNLRWLARAERGEYWIAFIDRTDEVAAIRNSVIIASLSFFTALVAFFAISLFLSRWALRPVEKAWEQQRRFVADASHELKTPLTVILANTGILLENREDTIANQVRWIENSLAEAGRMKRLIGNLLFLAKTDDASAAFVFSRICLSDLVFSIALAFEALAFEKGIEIHTSGIEPDIYMQGDISSLEQLTSILLENALKFSAPGGSVTVALRAHQSRALLSVNNSGDALTPQEQQQIFDRFYRADTARASEGYGLGLAIAKSIAETHRGKISVESTAEHGTTFTVRLPAEQA